MKYLILLAAIVGCAWAQAKGKDIPIVRQAQDISPDGHYEYSYETGDGITKEEKGEPRAIGNEIGNAARGSFQYTDLEGNKYEVTYIADENGFQPQGAHLPVAPPIPEAILKSLEWNKAHPEEDDAGTPSKKKF